MVEELGIKSWKFNYGDGREIFSNIEDFLSDVADEKTILRDSEKIHPEMPHDANLKQVVDEIEDDPDTSLESVSWYRFDPENHSDGIKTMIEDYLDLDNLLGRNLPRARERDRREMMETPSRYLDLYVIDGFTEGTLMGDKEVVERACRRMEAESASYKLKDRINSYLQQI